MDPANTTYEYGRTPSVSERRSLYRGALIIILLLLIGVAVLGMYMSIQPPKDFPIGQRIEIPQGTTLIDAAKIMDSAGAVRSSFVLQVVLLGQFSENGIRAGAYQFEEPLSTPDVARAIVSGTHGVPLVRITIPEGLRNAQIDAIVADRLDSVTPGEFTRYAEGKEGYLFPETYHVPETYTAEELVTLMSTHFEEMVETVQEEIDASDYTRDEIIIMASILEREADSEASMKLVSDILWRRLAIDMPLQVDASFAYLLDKTSEEITMDDLQIDSPYNTYRYRGLPPTPISNPGLQAITAALNPTPSPYLYYLTAPDGTFYYAKTFAEHQENIALYLRN